MQQSQAFDSDGVSIAFDDVGDGPPIVLVHGFASDRRGTWAERGVYDALVESGRRVIALDCRGHGESDKPRDSAAYESGAMHGDVVRLLDHLDVETADAMGYSMGGRIVANLASRAPDRVNAVVLGGVGPANLHLDDSRERSAIADAMEADDPADVDDPRARGFREFAERGDNDLSALAAYQRSARDSPSLAAIDTGRNPVLVLNGADDDIGDAQSIADDIGGARAASLSGRDHLSTVSDDRFVATVRDFLADHGLPASD